jgi:solute carrier family 25 protein 38
MADNKSSSLTHLLAGSSASFFTTVLFQPLDVVKTKKQQLLFNKAVPGIANTKYTTMIGTMKTVVKEEGTKGLWKGTAPSVYRTVPGVGLYFVVLNNLQAVTRRTLGSRADHSLAALFCGASARCLATMTLMPITVVKTRFEASGTNQIYRGTFDALKTIASQEGARGLYSGWLATIARDAPFSGLYFMFYSKFRENMQNVTINNKQVPHTAINLSSGLTAGVIATLVTHPPDVIKTRLQTQVFGSENSNYYYKNTWDAMIKIYKTEGINAFFKGAVPRVLRRSLMSAFTWTFYEEIKRYVNTFVAPTVKTVKNYNHM